jgi:hypothetical protein
MMKIRKPVKKRAEPKRLCPFCLFLVKLAKFLINIIFMGRYFLFLKNRFAAPFAEPQPSIPALLGLPSLFSSPSFFAAHHKIFFAVFFTLVSIGAAVNRGAFLPFADYGIAIRSLLIAFCLTHTGPQRASDGWRHAKKTDGLPRNIKSFYVNSDRKQFR